ncbi:MAG: VOC family protein [Fimbriimonadaceae bacterium]|nr:VOC family protein [Fimbriimonadaceae bacterium]
MARTEEIEKNMSKVSKIAPYIHFRDDCLEAMTFYHQCLGGEIMVMKVGDSPMAEQMPGMGDLVMHSQITGDDWMIMASDWCAPSDYIPGNNSSIMVECSSEAEQTALYQQLSEGGTATMPLEDTFWGARFGMLKDRFGVDWMLNLTKSG